jgi:hypothetical protein
MHNTREKLEGLIRNAHKKCKAKKTCHECEQYGNGSDCVYRFIAEKLIANGVTVQEWISVDDRLPENDVMVIGYTPCDGFMFVGYYHQEPKYDWEVWRIVTAMRSTKVMKKKVTHWLPLPQPPKGE